MKIYFMGICGTAMGNAALLARADGHEVLGSDQNVYPPMSDVLSSAGITLHEGYDATRLEQLAPDLVVIGNAMTRGNPEVEWLLETRRFRFSSLPALLTETVLTNRNNLVIAGTHGKTTTTALTAFLLRENGRDPGFLIGGVPLDPPVGQHLGTPTDPFVVEGDEYDSAFFDKRSKFIHYAPHIAVINNLEFDHADIFRDLTDIKRTFRHLTRIVPRNGFILLNDDDANLTEFRESPWTQVRTVGTQPTSDLAIVEFNESPAGASFSLQWQGTPWGKVSWSMPGLFNARNAAMAALSAGLALNPRQPTELSLAPLTRFRGVKRRQEIKLQRNNLTVIEDFGHHPSALAATLTSLRSRYPTAQLTAVFEPRSNTARSRVHQNGFIDALALADHVLVGAINRADRLGADERLDTATVTQSLAKRGVSAMAADNNFDLLEPLRTATHAASAAQVVVFFTNGSFDGIIDKFVESESV